MKHVVCSFLTGLYLLSNIMMTHAGDISKLESLHWMLGEWKMDSVNREVTESWEKVSDTVYTVYKGSNKMTIKKSGAIDSEESLLLVEMSGAVYYLAKVPQNPLPVPFKLIVLGNRIAVFENPGHDFPKRIEYSINKDGELDVYVTDGKDKSFELLFQKMKSDQ